MNKAVHNPRVYKALIFALAAALHILLLYFVVFNAVPALEEAEAAATVMKLVDVAEFVPPPPPPPPPEEPPPENAQSVDAVTENYIESDDPPPVVVTSAPVVETVQAIEYLSMSKISELPRFPEDTIRKATVYPAIALRSKIEGQVVLELYVDSEGGIRDIRVLQEKPAGHGFAEAAVKAFEGVRGTPAKANGVPVAVRYRYPVRFSVQ